MKSRIVLAGALVGIAAASLKIAETDGNLAFDIGLLIGGVLGGVALAYGVALLVKAAR